MTSNGQCILVSREQIRPAFGTELWPVHEHILQEIQDHPPDDHEDARTGTLPPEELPPVPEDDELDEEDIDRAPLFDMDGLMDDVEYTPSLRPEAAEQPETPSHGTDLTTLPATSPHGLTRAPGTPVDHLWRIEGQESKKPRLEQVSTGSAATPPPQEEPMATPRLEPSGVNIASRLAYEVLSNVAELYMILVEDKIFRCLWTLFHGRELPCSFSRRAAR